MLGNLSKCATGSAMITRLRARAFATPAGVHSIFILFRAPYQAQHSACVRREYFEDPCWPGLLALDPKIRESSRLALLLALHHRQPSLSLDKERTLVRAAATRCWSG